MLAPGRPDLERICYNHFQNHLKECPRGYSSKDFCNFAEGICIDSSNGTPGYLPQPQSANVLGIVGLTLPAEFKPPTICHTHALLMVLQCRFLFSDDHLNETNPLLDRVLDFFVSS